jgi:hypothetical protein
MCFGIYNAGEITGCIEISRLFTDEDKIKYRTLTYWIDKNNVRKGIMYKCLKILERIFIKQELNVLTTEVDIKNVPSINLMKKLGFKLFSTSFQISENGKTMCHFYTFQKTLVRTDNNEKSSKEIRRKKEIEVLEIPNKTTEKALKSKKFFKAKNATEMIRDALGDPN